MTKGPVEVRQIDEEDAEAFLDLATRIVGLYKKMGFAIEGIKTRSVKVRGEDRR